MEIAIASDHRGYDLKEFLKRHVKAKFKDFGALEYNKKDDYVDYIPSVCRFVKKHRSLGILICGTGLGMEIGANKVNGIAAALCFNEKMAEMSRTHNNADILVLASDFTSNQKAEKICNVFLKTKFSKASRHVRRLNKVRKLEE